VPYHSIEDPVKLRRVLDAILLLEGDLQLPSLLRHVIEEARSMTGAQYCALGVLNHDRTALVEFLTSGLEPEQEQMIGDRPVGLGVLGLLINEPRTLRLSRLDEHPEKYGFPANHPPMTSFLGVSIKVRNEVYGNLYLTDKIGSKEFTDDDQALVEALAVAAGIAIENARLHQLVREAAVFEDRDRMARDLHDTVIQHLFAVGLSLQSMAGAVAAAGIQDRLHKAVSAIDDTISQIRTTIYELGVNDVTHSVRSQLLSIVHDFEAIAGYQVEVSFAGPVDFGIGPQVVENLLATAGEALSNIGRHAHASAASLSLSVAGGMCRLQVLDNGAGIEDRPESRGDGSGMGLANLRRRAEKLHGEFTVGTAPDGGTSLTWQVPLAS
jgi:signal transduction histidine kinase